MRCALCVVPVVALHVYRFHTFTRLRHVAVGLYALDVGFVDSTVGLPGIRYARYVLGWFVRLLFVHAFPRGWLFTFAVAVSVTLRCG